MEGGTGEARGARRTGGWGRPAAAKVAPVTFTPTRAPVRRQLRRLLASPLVITLVTIPSPGHPSRGKREGKVRGGDGETGHPGFEQRAPS